MNSDLFISVVKHSVGSSNPGRRKAADFDSAISPFSKGLSMKNSEWEVVNALKINIFLGGSQQETGTLYQLWAMNGSIDDRVNAGEC